MTIWSAEPTTEEEAIAGESMRRTIQEVWAEWKDGFSAASVAPAVLGFFLGVALTCLTFSALIFAGAFRG